jgi:hypothetical protein
MLQEIIAIFAPFVLPNVTYHALCFAPFFFDEKLVEKCKTRKYNYASTIRCTIQIQPLIMKCEYKFLDSPFLAWSLGISFLAGT